MTTRMIKNANGKYFPSGIEVREPNEFYLANDKKFGSGYLSLILTGVLAVAGLVKLCAGESETLRDGPARVVSLMDNRYGQGSVESMLQRAKQRGN